MKTFFMFIKSEPLYEKLCNNFKTDFTKVDPWEHWENSSKILFLLAKESVTGCELFLNTVKELVESEDFCQTNISIEQYKKRDNPKFQKIYFLFQDIFQIKNTKEYGIIKEFHLFEKCFKLFDKQKFYLVLESYIKIKSAYIHSNLEEFYMFLKEIDQKIMEFDLLMDLKNIGNYAIKNINLLNYKLQKDDFYNFIEKLLKNDSVFMRYVALIIINNYISSYQYDETNLKLLIKFRNDKSLFIQKVAIGSYIFNEKKGERSDKK
ncbi:hypothetical protein M0812_11925 [Anaeramoeba flamelloides]|uniref:Uncharacterized protein n=1 Tax=Anaeramoeba flamelloides TaxID=1746091 RepID=A0AAV7ZQB9_9EUKA|nr:hypothetical protein M0812_11925 [Anaeramoeba flamelloides]